MLAAVTRSRQPVHGLKFLDAWSVRAEFQFPFCDANAVIVDVCVKNSEAPLRSERWTAMMDALVAPMRFGGIRLA